MIEATLEPDRFLLEDIRFCSGVLNITIGDGHKPTHVISFKYARAFQYFDESDRYGYVDSYPKTDVVILSKDGGGVFRSESSPYLCQYLQEITAARQDHRMCSYLVLTAQECVEVIGFEDPELEQLID